MSDRYPSGPGLEGAAELATRGTIPFSYIFTIIGVSQALLERVASLRRIYTTLSTAK